MFINFRHMYTKQMSTLKDWTCLCLKSLANAQRSLPTLMNIKQQLWRFMVKHTLYHHGLWAYCQIAGIRLSILPRLVHAGGIFGASGSLHDIILCLTCTFMLSNLSIHLYLCLTVVWVTKVDIMNIFQYPPFIESLYGSTSGIVLILLHNRIFIWTRISTPWLYNYSCIFFF